MSPTQNESETVTYRCGREASSPAREPTPSPSALRRMHSLTWAYHLVLRNAAVTAAAAVAAGTGAGMAVGMYVAGTGLWQQRAGAVVAVGVSKIGNGVWENQPHPPSH